MQQALTPGTVAAYLRAHPGFLAAQPDLYQVLQPPRRVHGEILADHMQAMLDRTRELARAYETVDKAGIAERRTYESFTRRVQEAVLSIMRAPDPAWLVTHELAGVLRIDAARLSSDAANRPAGVACLPPGTVAACLGQRSAILRAALADTAPLLHGEAVALAAREAIIRVPLMRGPALLALAARDAAGLEGATTGALTFLGQAVGTALDRPG